MNKESNTYTLIFALAVCVVCSVALATVSLALKDRQEANVILDIQQNILKVMGIEAALGSKMTAQEVANLYRNEITELVIDRDGNVVPDKAPQETGGEEGYYPLYVYRHNGKVETYCFPVQGKGLWSTLYGYFSLEADAVTVKGITFYRQGETPGLGAQVGEDWFQDNFKGKKIWDVREEKLTPIVVLKGRVADKIPLDRQPYYVDGISGATMTCQGVTAMLKQWLEVYEPFFKKVRITP